MKMTNKYFDQPIRILTNKYPSLHSIFLSGRRRRHDALVIRCLLEFQNSYLEHLANANNNAKSDIIHLVLKQATTFITTKYYKLLYLSLYSPFDPVEDSSIKLFDTLPCADVFVTGDTQ